MTDIPYNTLKQDERAYEIMLLRDQRELTYAAIAKAYKRSVTWVTQKYKKAKTRQKEMYIRHIAIVLGHPNTEQIRRIYDAAYASYRSRAYASAYMEMRYQDILTEYRAGEPGMPRHFIEDLPPLMPEPSEETVARIVELREAQNASFIAIAKALGMTKEKVKRTYDGFYHAKVIAIIKSLQDKTENDTVKDEIGHRFFSGEISSKKRYERMMEELGLAMVDTDQEPQ